MWVEEVVALVVEETEVLVVDLEVDFELDVTVNGKRGSPLDEMEEVVVSVQLVSMETGVGQGAVVIGGTAVPLR